MKKILFSFMAVLVAIFGVYIAPNKVYAAENVSYDETTIISDLGSSFLSDYPADENGKLTVMSFQEYGYSSAGIGDYGLYFYLYNPTRKNLSTDSFMIEIATNYADGEPVRYEKKFLTFLSKTSDNLYYKLKLSPSTAFFALEQSYMQNYGKRRYDLVGIETKFISDRLATDYRIDQTYYWTGYAIGCNGDNVVSTLACTYDSLETIDVKVHQTVYRPKGDYYMGEQSQLNSCFFSVDDRFFEKYGDLKTISCEWYEYFTKPVLVTRNEIIYNSLRSSYGRVNAHSQSPYDLPFFLIMGFGNHETSLSYSMSCMSGWVSNLSEYDPRYDHREGIIYVVPMSSSLRFDQFAAVFLCGNDYTKAVISSDELESQLYSNSSHILNYFSANLRLSRDLFEDYVCEGHTLGYNRKDISIDEPFTIYSNKTTRSFWQNFFVGGFDVETEYETLKAFQTVTVSDIYMKSNSQIADSLKISVADVPALREEVINARSSGKRVMLFRYSTSDYISSPIVQTSRYYSDSEEGEVDNDLVQNCAHYFIQEEYSGYFARETVFLDFDIISFTFETVNGVQTVVPVVSSPTNAIAPITPPLAENYHDGLGGNVLDGIKKALMIILGVIAAILVLFIVLRIAPLISARKQTAALKRIEKNLKKERDKKNE